MVYILCSNDIGKYLAIANDRCRGFIAGTFYGKYGYLFWLHGGINLKQNKLNNLYYKIFQFFRRSLIIVFFLFLFVFVSALTITQVPAIQNILVKNIASALGKSINYPIELKKVSISWMGELVLHDVLIKDRKSNE